MAASMIAVLIPGADISPFILLGAIGLLFILWFGKVLPEMKDGKK